MRHQPNEGSTDPAEYIPGWVYHEGQDTGKSRQILDCLPCGDFRLVPLGYHHLNLLLEGVLDACILELQRLAGSAQDHRWFRRFSLIYGGKCECWIKSECQYGENIPGVRRLAEDLGIDIKTVNSALQALETEGLLLPQGAGRQRRVNPHRKSSKTGLRIEIILYERNELNISYHVDIRHRLESEGHSVSFAAKTLSDLGMDVSRVERYVRGVGADAWVVTAASREILKWFSEQPAPAFALSGRFRTIQIAAIGPDKISTMTTVVEYLIQLGHRRIVMLSREGRRKPVPAAMERRFWKPCRI